MAAYYLDPSWTGPYNGTEAQPFNSWAQVSGLNPGDSVYIKRGTAYPFTLLYDSSKGSSGTSGSPITIGAYGTGAKPICASDGYVVDVVSRGYVIVQDLDLRPLNSFSSGGVRYLNSVGIVRRCTTDERCDYGVRIDNDGATPLDSVLLEDLDILGTYSNAAALVVWGTSIGGTFANVAIKNCRINNVGKFSSAGSPMGIRLLSRQEAATSSAGTVDLDTFTKGVQITGNQISNTRSYGLVASVLSTAAASGAWNTISGNTLTNIGDGMMDSHMLWVAAARRTVVEDNVLNGSTMFQGGTQGTGVGVFIDRPGGVGADYDGCDGVIVRRNRISNTGRGAEGSLNTTEVAGAGILVLQSKNIQVYDNDVNDCNNGIGVLGWYGSGMKSTVVGVSGNRVRHAARTAISVARAADAVTVTKNSVIGGAVGIALENQGAYACTGYAESSNSVSASSAYVDHTGAARTPTAGNQSVASQQGFENPKYVLQRRPTP